MKQIIKTFGKCIVLLLIISVIGFALIAGSYALPEKTILYNASISTDFLVSEYIGKDMEWMNWPDFYTDMVMVNIASYSDGEESVIGRAIENNKIGYTNETSYPFEIVRWLSERTPVEKTWYSYSEATATYEPCSYGKYWNGYLVLLRPLLLYHSMWQIYKIFKIIMSIAFGAVFLVMLVHDWRFAFPFGLAFLTLRPYSKFCLTYAIIEILLCVFMCVAIVDPGIKKSNVKRNVFFFIVGAITSYFTLMSFSIVIPVFCAVYLAYQVDIKNESNFSRAGVIVELVFWYCMGFCCMWAMKWVLLALYDRSLLGEVIESIRKRSSHDDYGDTITLWETILWNMCGYYYKNKALTWSIWAATGEIIIVAVLSAARKESRIAFKDCAALGAVLLITVGRYAVTMNHSRVHYFFMNRLLSGIAFTLLAIGAIWISKGIKDIGKTKKAEQNS